MGSVDDLSPWPEPSHAEPQAGMVGLAPAESGMQIGPPEPSPEELEKMMKSLAEQKQLGIYTNEELLEVNGKKILPDKTNPNLGRDVETGAELARHHSGAWLQQGDGEYEATRQAVTAQGADAHKPDHPHHSTDTPQQIEERHRLENFIDKTVAQDLGSSEPHPVADAIAQQKRVVGMSDAELSKIAGKLAAINGALFTGVEEIDPRHLRPDPVGQSQGEQSAYAQAQAKIRKENEQFALLDARKKNGLV